VQEISLLRLREVIAIGPEHPSGYRIKDVLVLPKNFTKGARATQAHRGTQHRTSVRFPLDDFGCLVKSIVSDQLTTLL
jgi:hypothetical protein